MKKTIALILALIMTFSACLTAAAVTDDSKENDAAVVRGDKPEVTSTAAAGYPKLSGVDPLKDGNKIKWQAYAGAVKYRVFVKNSGSWKKLADTASLSYSHTKAKINTSYTYTVRALNKSGAFISGFDKNGVTFRRLAAPTIKSIENVAGGVKITVNSVKGTSKNCVFVKGGTYGSSWKKLGYGGGTVTVSITKGNGGNTLSFCLRGCSADNKYLSVGSASKACTIYDAPKLKTASVNGGQKLTVVKIAGAYSYRIYIRSGGKWTKLADTKTSYTNKNVAYGKTYTYTVRALDYFGKLISGYYSTGFSLQYLTTPQITKIENVDYATRVSWNAIKGADHYRLFYKRNAGDAWLTGGDTIRDHYDLDMNSADEGHLFYYTVRAMDANNNYISSYDTNGKTFVYEGTPEILYIENYDDGITLTVHMPKNVPGYRVFLKSGTGWTPIGESYEQWFTYDQVEYGESYVFTVRGIDAQGNFMTWYDRYGWEDSYLYRRPDPQDTCYDADQIARELRQIGEELGMKYKEGLDNYADHKLLGMSTIYGNNCGDVTEKMVTRGRYRLEHYLERITNYGYYPGEYYFEVQHVFYDGTDYYILAAKPI